MNEAQRQLFEQFKQENQATVASIYDEDEDDSEQGGLNREQKQLFNQFIEQREGQKRRAKIESNTPTGLIDTTYNTVRRGLSRLANIPNVMMTEQFSELASAQRKKEEEDARLAAEGKERPWWYKALSWQREGAKNTADELDALAADKAKDVIERELYTQENFPMSESAKKQIEKITSTDKFFGQEGAIVQALSDPLATASGALQVAGEQIPTLAAVLVAARRSPKLAASVMGTSTFLQERFGQLVSEAQEAGYDLSNPEQALAAVKDKDFMAAQADKGFTRGSIIAATDLIFLGLASRAKFNLKGIGTQTGVQALGGGTGEFLAQVASGDEISPGDILIESLAEGVSAPVDVAAFGLKKASEKLKTSQGTENSETRVSPDETELFSAQDLEDLQNKNDEEDAKAAALSEEQMLEQARARMQAAKSFISDENFFKQRNQKRKNDALNPQTEIGRAYELYKARLQKYPTTQKAENALLDKFLKSFIPKNDKDVAIEEYNTALDAHASAIAAGTITPVDNDARRTKPKTETTPVETTTETTETPETPVVETTEVKPPKPEGKVVAAQRAYAEEKLGKDWETIGGLSQAFENRTGFYKKDKNGRTAFQNRVDAEVAARDEETSTTAEPETNEVQADTTALTQQDVKDVVNIRGLSKDQKKIFDVLSDHFFGDKKFDIDDVYAGGKFQPTKIAELAGVKSKQAVSTTINRFRTKIAQEMGIIPENATAEQKKEGLKLIGERLSALAQARKTPARTAETATTDELADTQDAVDQRPDSDEVTDDDVADNSIFQQQGISTIASVGQGAFTGVSKEDVEYTKARSNEPDQYESKRQELADKTRAEQNIQMVQTYGQEAIAQWRSTRSEGAVDVRDLSKKDLLEWITVVEENRVGEISDSQMRQEQREIEKRYDAETKQPRVNEVQAARAVEGPEGRDTTEQSGTQDNRETQPQEGDPDSFTAVEDQAGKVKVESKKPKRRFSVVPDDVDPFAKLEQETDEKEANFEQVLKDLTGKNTNWRVKTFRDVGDMIAARLKGDIDVDVPKENFYAFTQPNDKGVPVTYIILDRIPKGRERGVFLHEVGGHQGLDDFISLDEQAKLGERIKEFANKNDNSIESVVANRVLDRITRATLEVPEIETNKELQNSELIGYFLEEATFAGVEPSVQTPIGRLVRDLYALFKRALRKINMNIDAMTAQDIVDLGWGAARFSLSTRKHGTAASFQKFDHRFMSRGEGAQAYGWGSYLAERFGIARFYLRADESRKTEAQAKEDPNNPENFKLFLSALPEPLQTILRNPPNSVVRSGAIFTDDRDVATPETGVNLPKPHLVFDGKRGSYRVKYPNRSGTQMITKTRFGKPLTVQTILVEANKGFSLIPFKRNDTAKAFDQKRELDALAQKEFRAVQDANRVEGSFMHVDTTVADEELLPWADFVGSNSQVKDAIVKLINGMENIDIFRILEEVTNKNQLPSTDREKTVLDKEINILKKLRKQHDEAFDKLDTGVYEGILDVSNQLNIPDDLVSNIMDTVSGESLYWAMTQYNYITGRPYTYLTEEQQIKLLDAPEAIRPDQVVSLLLDNVGVKGVIYPDAGTLGNFAQDSEGMANNVVIFNEDNLFVVGTTPGKQVGNKKNRVAEIKFSISDDHVDNSYGSKAKDAFIEAKEIARQGAASVEFLHQVIRRVREKMPSLGRWYEGMLKIDQTRTEIRKSFEGIALRARALKPERLALLNDFLGKSTFFQKWGYDPEIDGKEVTVDPVFERAFNKLTSEEQQIVKDVFAHGEKMRLRKIEIAKKAGVEGKFFTDAALQGPYAPLKRFGSYVAVLKSQQMKDAEDARNAEGATKEDRERYDKLSQDPKHYVVSFFDTFSRAKKFTDSNPQYKFRSATKKAPDPDEGRVSNPQVFEKILGALNAGEDSNIDGQAKQAFKKLVQDLYFQSLDERNARLSGSKRLNRAGYEKNMIRSFISHAKAEANLIAQMENAAEVNTAFAEAEKETRVDGVRDKARSDAFALVAAHYRRNLKGDETPIQDRINAANSVYMLLTSTGYHVTNATQPTMVTVPKVAGDFGDYSGAWNGLLKGYKLAMELVSMSAQMETNVDTDSAPPEYRDLLKRMELSQLLDVGMEEDLTSFERFDTGFDTLNVATDTLGKTTHKLYQVSRLVEAVNRISAAISAFDMAKKYPERISDMKMSAEEYAVSVVEDTQGNFSSLDAPLLIKALPKVITQYRKYQLLMAWHYSSAFKQMFKGETAQSRAAGRRILMYSLAHAGVFAGSVGIPLSSTLFWLATFLGDEDEPQDLERWIKKNIDDGLFGDVLSRGALGLVGIDLSAKLSQNKIFHPLPYVDFQLGEAGWKEIIAGSVGPAGTTAGNFFRAAEYFAQGDAIKGIEYMVPKGIRSVLESYRLATEGYTMRNGDVVVDPREISGLSIFLNSLGIPGSDIQKIKWTRGQQFELEQYFSKQSGRLRKSYIEAYKNRDTDLMSDLRGEWKDLQKAKDRVRPFFNDAPGVLNKQPVSDLIKAPREQRKRERKARRKFGN